MSLTFSPSTGKLVKVGSKEFADLLKSPTWGKHFTSPLTSVVPGKGIPVNTGLKPATTLPPGLPPSAVVLPISSNLPKTLPKTLPALPSLVSNNTSLPPLPTNLPPLPNTLSGPTIPAPSSPAEYLSRPISSLPLPPVVLSPRTNKQYPSERVNLSLVSVPTYKVWEGMNPSNHVDSILSLPVYDIPSLEKVLENTRQPYLQKKLKTMIETQKEKEHRGSSTRGWSARAPQKGKDRNQLMDECGDMCFLRPENKGFPICPKCQLGPAGKCQCEIDCGAVQAAKNRAAQWGYTDIESKADKILQKKCH